jgi:hypothetical protein
LKRNNAVGEKDNLVDAESFFCEAPNRYFHTQRRDDLGLVYAIEG